MLNNYLSPNGFRFNIKRLPQVSYFGQKANLPGLTANKVNFPTPFKSLPIHGDQLEFGEFTLTFKVDEDMRNHAEIMGWMIGLTFPDDFGQFANLKADDGLYSDGSLIILNSNQNPNIEVTFKNMWPMALGDIDLDITNADVQYSECQVTFNYESFSYKKL
jgi:hypothetical protein